LIRIHEQRTVPLTQEEAFDFVGDFTNVAEWDPGITASKKIGDGPVGVGTRFEVVSEFVGRSLDLTYVVEEWDAPDRAVVATETKNFAGRDTITFRSVDGGTEIDYVAEFTFKGVMRAAEPFLGGTFDKLGKKAMDGVVEAVAVRTS
jgi:hypothetical protein